jgi:dsDNA-specific endonuclease/ATPase MutS2
MTEIDLHGMRHEHVKTYLENTINQLWLDEVDLKIITGHSPRMKKIVTDILDEYKLKYRIGDFSGQNMGYITAELG